MVFIEKPLRDLFMFMSKNKFLNTAAKKWGLGFGASQVVAGDTLTSAINKVASLNENGLLCTLDHLGEFVSTKQEALESTEHAVHTLEAIAQSSVRCNLSVKMTQLGLDIDHAFCLENMRKILEVAKKHHNFVRIDMEDYSHCQTTLDILKTLRNDYENVGTVIQAYLYRSMQDIKDLRGVPLRLVKGAYKESPSVAYQNKSEIDENYLALVKQHLQGGSYTAIATHDHEIIAKMKKYVQEHNIPNNQFEFQMLYGFRTDLQLQLVKEGYTMRVYVPFGTDWFGYFMRRMAERPQNVSFALRGFFSK